jgi:DNA replication protein DnaC
LAIVLGREACLQGRTVRFFTAARLCNELIEAQDEKRLLTLEKQWLKADLVIIDELGYLPYSQRGSELLFQWFASRYERGSMIIASNREFSQWTEVFSDEQLTAALLDRLTHRAHIFPMNDESYRFKDSFKETD